MREIHAYEKDFHAEKNGAEAEWAAALACFNPST